MEDEPPIPLIPAPIPQVLRAQKEDNVRTVSPSPPHFLSKAAIDPHYIPLLTWVWKQEKKARLQVIKDKALHNQGYSTDNAEGDAY